MAIRFACEQCRHPFDVDDELAGMKGRCKHCGHIMIIPEPEGGASSGSFRLRPLDPDDSAGHHHLLESRGPALELRPAESEPDVNLDVISMPPAAAHAAANRGDASSDYVVVGNATEVQAAEAAPPIPWTVVFLQFARFVSGNLLAARNWLYVVSLTFLGMALYGYVFQFKTLLHVGALGVIATNIGMLVVGVFYLVSLPFKEGPVYGFANMLCPPYAVYYWVTRWGKMKTPVLKTASSFLPILLVAIAYLVYTEAPVVEKVVEEKGAKLEEELDRALPNLEQKLDGEFGRAQGGDSSKAVSEAPSSTNDAPSPASSSDHRATRGARHPAPSHKRPR
jgi:hypothetical protein